MTRGVTLIAVAHRGYLDWAINMACSIAYYSPDIKIQLIVSENLRNDAVTSGFFDYVTPLQKSDYCDSQDRLFPAKLKLDLYRHLIFDETIYLDVDGFVIKDITPIFETKADLSGDIQGVYDKSMGELFNHLKWCKPSIIWDHYGLPEDAKLPAINSSFMFIRKSVIVEAIFKQAYDNLMANPIPVNLHWNKWGKVTPYKVNQPDELYFDIALAQHNYIPEHNVAVYFRLIIDRGDIKKFTDLQQTHYAIGLFGDLRTNHHSLKDIYNREMNRIWQAMGMGKFYNTADILAKTKFAVN